MKYSCELVRRLNRLTTWAVLVGALTGFAVVTTTAAPWWVWLIGMFVPLLAKVGLMWWVVSRGDGNQGEKQPLHGGVTDGGTNLMNTLFETALDS